MMRADGGSGRITLWSMLAIVVTLTVGLSVLAVRLRIGIPPANSTQIAELARTATGGGSLFGAFQVTTAILLLASSGGGITGGACRQAAVALAQRIWRTSMAAVMPPNATVPAAIRIVVIDPELSPCPRIAYGTVRRRAPIAIAPANARPRTGEMPAA